MMSLWVFILGLALFACSETSTRSIPAVLTPAAGVSGPSPSMMEPKVPSMNASQPGEPQPEPSTPLSLALRWPVKGDANRNATINVRFRKVGASDWRTAYPLFRTTPAKLSPENRVADGWLFAG